MERTGQNATDPNGHVWDTENQLFGRARVCVNCHAVDGGAVASRRCLNAKECAGCGDGNPCTTQPHEFIVRDSGHRTQFPSGSVRDARTGKGRPDLISPIFLTRLAIHSEKGAVKYKDRNWEKGQPMCESYFGSAKRHLDQWLEGDNTEDHLAAAAWNVMALIHTGEMIERGLLPKELNDRPNYLPRRTD